MEKQEQPKLGTIFSAMFLVAGTIIGGGMLALPSATGVSGFWPSTLWMVVCWFMMTVTALLFLEVSLWMEEGVHVISMTSRILGPIGKAVAWILYLFICYASLIAYTAGGGLQIVQALQSFFGTVFSKNIGTVIFVILFGSVFYFGNHFVGRLNTVLFLAMVTAYFALVGMGMREVQPAYLTYRDWSYSWVAIPLFLTSFSFQTMVPSLTPYLNRHASSLRWAIIGGTTISLIVYFLWQWLILGIVPVEGPNGLEEALRRGEPPIQFISEHVQGWHVAKIAEFFAFFAIITSFLGIGLGLFDFLSDGLKIKERGLGKVALSILVAVPTLFFAMNFERVFYTALDATGGYGDSILNGIIPVLLMWVGIKKFNYGANTPAFLKNKVFLTLVFLFFLSVLLIKFGVDIWSMNY